jgi:hypothetical protein
MECVLGELAIAESIWRLNEFSSYESYRVLPQSHFVLFEYFSMFVKFSSRRGIEKKQKKKRVLEKGYVLS